MTDPHPFASEADLQRARLNAPLVTPIADALDFHHEDACPDPTDDSLLLVERYIGEEARRIKGIRTEEEDGNTIILSITLGTDAVSDEAVECVRQWVECRYCAGAPAGVPTDGIDYE